MSNTGDVYCHVIAADVLFTPDTANSIYNDTTILTYISVIVLEWLGL